MDENTKANCVIGVWHKWREKFWHKSGGFNLRDSLLHSPPPPQFFPSTNTYTGCSWRVIRQTLLMSIPMLLLLLFVQRLTRVFPRCDFSLVIYEETVERLHMIYIYFNIICDQVTNYHLHLNVVIARRNYLFYSQNKKTILDYYDLLSSLIGIEFSFPSWR